MTLKTVRYDDIAALNAHASGEWSPWSDPVLVTQGALALACWPLVSYMNAVAANEERTCD